MKAKTTSNRQKLLKNQDATCKVGLALFTSITKRCPTSRSSTINL